MDVPATIRAQSDGSASESGGSTGGGTARGVARLETTIALQLESVQRDMARNDLGRRAFIVSHERLPRVMGATGVTMDTIHAVIAELRQSTRLREAVHHDLVLTIDWCDTNGVVVLLQRHDDTDSDFPVEDLVGKALCSFADAVLEAHAQRRSTLVWLAYPHTQCILFSARQARNALRSRGLPNTDRIRLVLFKYEDDAYIRVDLCPTTHATTAATDAHMTL